MRNPSRFAKIQRERDRKERREDRARRKAERREAAKENPAAEDGVDPDIAHIVPGPQPLPESDDDL
jgi:hypothetical protein